MEQHDAPATVSADANSRHRARAAAAQIRQFVEEGIADFTFRVGDKLPTERELAVRFNTGRNTVRRILVALEREGKIVRQVGRGTFVVESEQVGAIKSRGDVTLASVARAASPLDLLEFRIAVEPNIAAFCVPRATQAQIEELRNAMDESLKATTFQDFENLDDKFHRTIAAATHNPLFMAIADLITTVRADVEWSRMKLPTMDERRGQHTAEHMAILSAIRERDERKAKQSMEYHLRQVKRIMFGMD